MSVAVLDVGNCGPDHATLESFLGAHFDVDLVQADDKGEALALLRSREFALVLVNRVMDRDGGDGLELIRAMKADPSLRTLPVMMLTNYPEHQERAVAEGAEAGFGKAELRAAATLERLKRYLA